MSEKNQTISSPVLHELHFIWVNIFDRADVFIYGSAQQEEGMDSADKINKRILILLSCGIGFGWAGIEILQMQAAPSMGAVPSSAIAYICSQLAMVGISLVFVCVPKLSCLFASKGGIVAAVVAVLVSVGLFLVLLSQISEGGVASFLVGVCLASVGSCLLDVGWIILLSKISPRSMRYCVVAASLICAGCVLSASMFASEAIPLTLVFFLMASAALLVSWWYIQKMPQDEDDIQKKMTHWTGFAAPLLAGIVVISLCFGFWQFTLISDAVHIVSANIISTHFVATAVFAIVAFFCIDNAYSTSLKVVCSLMLASFVTIAVGLPNNSLPSFFAAIAFSVFEYVSMIALADLIRYKQAQPCRIIGAFFTLSCAGQFFGCAIGWGEQALFPVSEGFSYAGLIIMLLLIVASVWWVTEPHLNAFFFGEKDSLTSNDAEMLPEGLSFEQRAGLVADAYALTVREKEIAVLFAMGRSATFIAEQLYLSTNTVRTHLMHAYSKLNVHSKQELISLIEAFDDSGASI